MWVPRFRKRTWRSRPIAGRWKWRGTNAFLCGKATPGWGRNGRKGSLEAWELLAPALLNAERLRSQTPKDKNKLYAWHAPEVECIGKGKARQLYEFGVKVGIAITAKCALIAGARSFPGNPYDGATLGEHWEQTGILTGVTPEQMIVDLGYRDRELDGARVLHKGSKKH